MLNTRKKEHRTRSHDPTSNRHGRASIQVDDTEKITCQLKRRICSVKKNRDKTNVTLENSSALPKVDLRRDHISNQLDKSSNQSFFRYRQDLSKKLGQLQQHESRDLRITANFGKASELRVSDNKMSV